MTSTALILLVVVLATVSLMTAAVAGHPALGERRAARSAGLLGIFGSLIALGLYLVLLWNPMHFVRYSDGGTLDPSGGATLTISAIGTVMAVSMAIAVPFLFRPRTVPRRRHAEPAPNRTRWDGPADDDRARPPERRDGRS